MNGSSPQNGNQHLDLLLLEALGYHGPLTSTKLIRIGLAAGVNSEETQRWLVSAAERGLIQRSLSDITEDTWMIS